MLPGVSRSYTSNSMIPEYIRRIIHYPQMDIEYTFWQMFYLCVNPHRVYRTTSWHKQTKNQWARDDPAFVAILMFFMTMASFAYAVAFKTNGFLNILKLIFWSVFVDFIGVGVLVATIGWWFANKYLRVRGTLHTVEQTVEWLYAFDIHCNSFFPVFLFLYVIQFFCVPLLLSTRFIATFFANTLYLVAYSYYCYITFLGYSALPFLHNTSVFFYPVAIGVVLWIVALALNFNLTILIMNFYFYSVPRW